MPRVLIGALVAVAVLAVATVVMRQTDIALAYTLFNTIAEKAQTNTGSYAFIETSDPDVSVYWAYNRIVSTSGNRFVEVGWIKQKGFSQDPSPYWASYDGSYSDKGRIDANPGVGTSYNYQVKHDSGDDWNIYFNQLNVVDHSVDINTSSTANVWVGAEVADLSDDIGDSTATGTSYRSTTGTFYTLCGMDETNNSEPNYSIEDLYGCGNWRFYDAEN